MTAVFDNGMDGTCCICSDAGWKYQDVLFDLGMRMSDLAHQDYVIKAESLRTSARPRAGRHRPRLRPRGGDDDRERGRPARRPLRLRRAADGHRLLRGQHLGSGLKERGDGGLTYFGERAVDRMNKLGIAIDISHSGDLTAMDVIEDSKKPVFITHCGSREVWPTNRMKPDAVIVAMRGARRRDRPRGRPAHDALPGTPRTRSSR